MSVDTIKAIEAHIQQLAPHQKERCTATLLKSAASELYAAKSREEELLVKLAAENNLKNLYHGELCQTAGQRNELAKQLEESKVDAGRYRFLRRAWAEPAVLSALNETNPEPESDAEFDAAIDAAMLSAAPQPPKEQP